MNNWLDLIIIALLTLGFVKGYADGLIRQVVMLLALVAAIYLCGALSVYIRGWIAATHWLPAHAVVIASYVVAFILIAATVSCFGSVLHKIMDVTPLSLFNHLAGGAFALIFTALVISLALNIMEYSDRNAALIPPEAKRRSHLYEPVRRILPLIYTGNLFKNEHQPESWITKTKPTRY